MKTILVFISFLYIQICSGRYFSERFFRQKPRIKFIEPELLDEVCKDAEGLEDKCAERAATKGYCDNHYEYMRQNCPESCGFCSDMHTQTPNTTGPIKSSVCDHDLPKWANNCTKWAENGDCVNPKRRPFLEHYCRKSCKLPCESVPTPNPRTKPPSPPVTKQPLANIVITQPPATDVTTQPPANVECKDDPSYECKDIAQEAGFCQQQESFTRTYCALSCGWCESPTKKAAAPEICDHDLPKWANNCTKWAENGDCDNPKRRPFLGHYCRKSCKLPCESVPTPNPRTKPPSPPAFCIDRDKRCGKWKSLGMCASENLNTKNLMAVYCGVTCDTCKEPTPGECYDKGENCEELMRDGECDSTVPTMEYEVKTNCLQTCKFCETKTIPSPIVKTKPPSPPAFCRDRDLRNCAYWKALGRCTSNDPNVKYRMAVYCEVTCDTCKAPTPAECYDKADNCKELKREGKCTHSNPFTEYNVKTNCLATCEFCVPDFP